MLMREQLGEETIRLSITHVHVKENLVTHFIWP